MRGKVLAVCAVVMGLTLPASAGSISGKVTGKSGESVVYVDAIAGKTFPAPTEKPVIDQRRITFRPRVIAVQQGTTVDFLNSDPVAHNVYWPAISGDKKLRYNLGTWPQGQTRSFKFDNVGVVPLLCIAHPEMSGYVIVTPTPYHAVTDKDGNYKIDNIPDGDYTLFVWHEGAKNASKAVKVAGDTKVDFTVSQ
ncbi:MAG TPA: carboxypeptidase regulatory-like domain-containing protein [Candidatus Acidoferrum sp.]|nr:carboxypeptidase regulatory-like domain-containing protein [Candidatus Acidoferrum sp.]